MQVPDVGVEADKSPESPGQDLPINVDMFSVQSSVEVVDGFYLLTQ